MYLFTHLPTPTCTIIYTPLYILIDQSIHYVHVPIHLTTVRVHDVIEDVERKKERKTPEAMEK